MKKNIKKKERILIAYVPVLHPGYIALFKKYLADIRLLGKDVRNDYTSLVRDVRFVDPLLMQRAIKSLSIGKKVAIVSKKDLKLLAKKDALFVMPDEDVSHIIAEKYLVGKDVRFENVFLRWDKIITLSEFIVPAGRQKSNDPKDKDVVRLAFEEANKSSDWWRQIGAVLVKDGRVVLVSHNRHLPTDYHLVINGDPRSNFNAGERLDIYTSIHGEADIIAKAARQGISLEGASIYQTVFPCSNCARLLGEAGIKKVYYAKGYSRLDAEDVLKAYGVEIILVEEDGAETKGK
jgi:dCMP deaminase